ncbi:class I SAM-dependent methyltransferase [Rubinisphaera margarita]|uniref:class I SAM-dependent methyltransferase n=1 Tax=Rubinisphaera margarita TaxID=2909586 RepID=UPI001EE82221|nr:methyltransferase domain-containing protein [Rubinisphaera margarita]MCG6154378.1 class I SAM-dependent methyltransferase [Rubinisphaera margarita]
MTANPQLPTCISQWRDEQIELPTGPLTLTIPADPDALLDDPDVLEESRRTDYVPYWAYLWPAAREMSRLLTSLDEAPAESALELGCGSGLIGLAAITRGIHITFSDYRQEALQLAAFNARQNGLTDFDVLNVDWFNIETERRFPWIIASDVLYEARFHEPFLNAVSQLLEPGGEIWIADPGRALVLEFVRLAQSRGWEPDVYNGEREPRSFPVIGQFQLLVFKPTA